MPIRVNIQGEIFPPEDARISVFDRQFLYGDGIYETMRTFGGRLFLVRPHLRRFHRSAEGIRLRLPWSDEHLLREMRRTLEATGEPESSIRVMVTRGEGEFGLDPTGIDEPRVVMIARPLLPQDAALARDGVDICIPSVRRTSPRALASYIKSGNYLNQAMALAEGRRRGAYEVVMLDDSGNVTEGSTSNVFWVRDGILYTPSIASGVLPGVTRALVLGLAARLGIPTARGLFPAEQLLSADESFITATLKELLPIRAIDGQRVSGPVAGPMTARLTAAYREITRRAADGRIDDDELDAILEAGGGELG